MSPRVGGDTYQGFSRIITQPAGRVMRFLNSRGSRWVGPGRMYHGVGRVGSKGCRIARVGLDRVCHPDDPTSEISLNKFCSVWITNASKHLRRYDTTHAQHNTRSGLQLHPPRTVVWASSYDATTRAQHDTRTGLRA